MTHALLIYRTYCTLPVLKLQKFRVLLLMRKFVHHKDKLPNVFNNYFVSNDSVHMYDTRHRTELHRHRINTSYGYRCRKYKEIKMWNSLPNSFKCIKSTTRFKRLVKNYLLTTVWLTDHMCTLCMVHCFLFLLVWFLILCLYDLISCGCSCLIRPTFIF